MTSLEEQDPLASSSQWEFQVKVETPDFEDLSSYENGQDITEQEQAHMINNDNYQGHNIDNYQERVVIIEPDDQQQDSDYKPNGKTKTKKPKKKYKNKKPQKPWKSNKLYPCPQCDYVANRYNNLTAHMGKHSDIKNLFCDFCPYSTRYKTSLRRHVKYQHVLNDSVEDCPWCNFKTSFKCNLKTHIQRLHSCSGCQFKGAEDEIRVHFNETHATEKESLSRYILKTAKRVAESLSNINNDNYQVKTEQNSDNNENENDMNSDENDKDGDDDENGSDIDDNIFAPECEIMEISNVSQSEGDLNGLESGSANEWNNKITIKPIKKKGTIEENKFSCTECEFTTRKCDNFVQHMQSNHDATFEIDNSYKCKHCDYTSRFKHNVRLHETKHTGEKIYKCTLCDYGTSYNTVFQRHQRKHAQKLLGPFLCDKCTFKTTTQGRLQYHMQKSHQIVNDTAHKCDYCDFYTDVKWRLNKHVNKSQSAGEVLCQYCEYRSAFKCQMRMHRKEHLWNLGGSEKVMSLRKSMRLSGFVHDGQAVDDSGQLDNSSNQLVNSSGQLDNSIGQLDDSNKQLVNSSEQLVNSSKQLVNSSGQLANSSGQLANSSGPLDNSNKQLVNNGQLVDHSGQVLMENRHPDLTFEQTVQGRRLTETDQNFSEDTSESNYSDHNNTDVSEYQSTSMSTVKPYDITTQNVSMAHTQNVLPHTQTDLVHTQNSMTQNNLFSYNSIEAENNSVKNCYTIDEGAMKLNQIRVGFDRSQEKAYSCLQCVYKAKYKAAVQRHYLRHHSSQIKPYKCKYCGFQTSTRDAMWKHTKRSQILDYINCECNQFSTRFRCELLQHKKLHNNFQCDLCSISYKSRYDLERHILNHPANIFKCTKCSYITDKEIFLLEHEAFHSGDKPFKCDVCSYATVKELLLNLHRRKWHGHLCKVEKLEKVKGGRKVSKGETSDGSKGLTT